MVGFPVDSVTNYLTTEPGWHYCCCSTFRTDQTVPVCLWSVNHSQTRRRTFWSAAIHPHTQLPPAATLHNHWLSHCMTWILSAEPWVTLSLLQWNGLQLPVIRCELWTFFEVTVPSLRVTVSASLWYRFAVRHTALNIPSTRRQGWF